MSRILGIGEQFPKFSAQAVVSTEKGKEFATLDNKNISGKWETLQHWKEALNQFEILWGERIQAVR